MASRELDSKDRRDRARTKDFFSFSFFLILGLFIRDVLSCLYIIQKARKRSHLCGAAMFYLIFNLKAKMVKVQTQKHARA